MLTLMTLIRPQVYVYEAEIVMRVYTIALKLAILARLISYLWAIANCQHRLLGWDTVYSHTKLMDRWTIRLAQLSKSEM